MLLEQMNDKIDGHYDDLVAWVPDFKTRDEAEKWLNEKLGDVMATAKEAYLEFSLGDDEKSFDQICSASAQAKACAVALTRFRHGLDVEFQKKKGKRNGKHS